MVVRKRKNRGGSVSWQLDCGFINGERVRISFRTRQAADDEKARRMIELRRHGEEAMLVSAEDRARYSRAGRELAEVGAGIEDAVIFYLKHHKALRPKPLGAAFEDFHAEKRAKGKRDRYLKQLRVSVGGFVRSREARWMHEITGEEVESWLAGNEWSARTQIGYLGDVRTFFAWAVRRRHATINPCAGIEPPELEQGEIEILSVEQCETLLNTALNYRRTEKKQHPAAKPVGTRMFAGLIGYAALGLFRGIRPERELGEMTVADIDLEGRTAVVRGKHAKTRERRAVDLPENAVAWLNVWRELCPDQTRVKPRNARNLWMALRKQAGITHWPHDAMRHTAASMMYALTQDESWVKAQLGHAEREDTLFKNYRSIHLPDGSLVTRAVAGKFYALTPGRPSP